MYLEAIDIVIYAIIGIIAIVLIFGVTIVAHDDIKKSKRSIEINKRDIARLESMRQKSKTHLLTDDDLKAINAVYRKHFYS